MCGQHKKMFSCSSSEAFRPTESRKMVRSEDFYMASEACMYRYIERVARDFYWITKNLAGEDQLCTGRALHLAASRGDKCLAGRLY